MQFAQSKTLHVALAADRLEACRLFRTAAPARDRAQAFAERIGIVGFDRGDAAGAEAQARQGSDRPARWCA